MPGRPRQRRHPADPGPRFASRIEVDLAPNALAAALAARRAAGARILDLTNSNPTRVGLRYPEAEILAALASPAALAYQPDPRGLPSARAAVSAYYASRGESVDPEDLLLTASSSESYALLFKLLADPGDEVLIPAPSYPLFDVLARLECVRLVRYPLVHNPGVGWRIQREALGAALSPRTRAIAVVHPNNPTGSYLRGEERAWLETLCASRELPLIADEVFLDYSRAAGEISFASTRGSLAFALSGLSKLVGLPQLKMGWIALAGPERARDRARARLEFIADAYLSVGAPVQHAAPTLLELRGALQRQIRERMEANELRLRERCASAASLRPLEREGGWYAVLELPESVDEEAFCVRLLEQHGVLVHPGYFFDFERPGVLVVSLLAEPGTFAEGVARLIESADSM
jgi:aspartate/methionine/tyrosine aminotransferase